MSSGDEPVLTLLLDILRTLERIGAPYKEDERGFEAEAKLLLAVKLYEMGRVSTGMAARLAGVDRVSFMFELDRFGLSPIGVDADELEQDMANA